MRRYPRINGPAVLPLFCLAPHGVFRASRITPRAVSSYLAFSTLPALRCQRTGGVFSVTLSVTALLQTQCPRLLRGMLPYGVRTFLWRTLLLSSDHLPSRGTYHRLGKQKEGINLEARKPGWNQSRAKRFPKKYSWFPGFQIFSDSFDHRFADSIVDLPRST